MIELSNVVKWFKINKLCLNINKTNFMIFRAKNKYFNKNETQLTVDGISVEQVNQTKFLGVYIDSSLNWTAHIKHISKKYPKILAS